MTLHHAQFQNTPGRFAATSRPVMRSVNHTNKSSVFNAESALENLEMRHRGNRAGNTPANITRNIPAFEITHGDYLKRVRAAMRAEAGNRPGAAKFIADKIECSPKTAQSWLDGETAPAGILDCRAMSRLPIYAALKREISAMETTMDPRLQAKYQELHRLTLELADGHGAP